MECRKNNRLSFKAGLFIERTYGIRPQGPYRFGQQANGSDNIQELLDSQSLDADRSIALSSISGYVKS